MAATAANDFLGTGRRKSSVAHVRLRPGSGNILVNKKPLEEYFVRQQDRSAVTAPLEQAGNQSEIDVVIRVHGGGTTGQSGACRLGIARALAKFDPELEAGLREAHLMTRDGRMKERKKPGLRGARKSTQFSKR